MTVHCLPSSTKGRYSVFSSKTALNDLAFALTKTNRNEINNLFIQCFFSGYSIVPEFCCRVTPKGISKLTASLCLMCPLLVMVILLPGKNLSITLFIIPPETIREAPFSIVMLTP